MTCEGEHKGLGMKRYIVNLGKYGSRGAFKPARPLRPSEPKFEDYWPAQTL